MKEEEPPHRTLSFSRAWRQRNRKESYFHFNSRVVISHSRTTNTIHPPSTLVSKELYRLGTLQHQLKIALVLCMQCLSYYRANTEKITALNRPIRKAILNPFFQSFTDIIVTILLKKKEIRVSCMEKSKSYNQAMWTNSYILILIIPLLFLIQNGADCKCSPSFSNWKRQNTEQYRQRYYIIFSSIIC